MKTCTDSILYIPPLIIGCLFVLNYTMPSPRQSLQGVCWSIKTEKVSSYPGRVSYFVSNTIHTKAAGTPHHSSPQRTEIKPLFLALCWTRGAAFSQLVLARVQESEHLEQRGLTRNTCCLCGLAHLCLNCMHFSESDQQSSGLTRSMRSQ